MWRNISPWWTPAFMQHKVLVLHTLAGFFLMFINAVFDVCYSRLILLFEFLLASTLFAAIETHSDAQIFPFSTTLLLFSCLAIKKHTPLVEDRCQIWCFMAARINASTHWAAPVDNSKSRKVRAELLHQRWRLTQNRNKQPKRNHTLTKAVLQVWATDKFNLPSRKALTQRHTSMRQLSKQLTQLTLSLSSISLQKDHRNQTFLTNTLEKLWSGTLGAGVLVLLSISAYEFSSLVSSPYQQTLNRTY